MKIAFDIILPIFGAMALGYLAARAGKFDDAANRGLSLFVFNFALPLLLFRSIALADLPDEMPWGFVFSYFLGAFIAFGGAMLAGRVLGGRSLHEQGVLGFCGAYSNLGMLGIPLVVTAYGPSASVPLFVIIACHSPIILPAATAVIEAGRSGGSRPGSLLVKLIRSMLATPIIWALSAGFAFSASGLTILGPIDAVAKGVGDAAAPCALFALGASLAGYRIRGNLKEPLAMVALKTLVHPLLVWLLATQVFTVPSLWTAVAVTLAALPAGVTPYLFAQRYKVCVETAASTILLSTVLAVATLSGLLFVFEAR